MSFYTRKLPHWQPDGAALFLTWRLDGSLPREYCTATPEAAPGRQFVEKDRIVDRAASGPTWLKDSRIAVLVADALRYGEASLQHSCPKQGLWRSLFWTGKIAGARW
jgi:hypothetical protein